MAGIVDLSWNQVVAIIFFILAAFFFLKFIVGMAKAAYEQWIKKGGHTK